MRELNRIYAVYNAGDELLAVGTLKECSQGLGIRYNSLVQALLRQEKNPNQRRRKYNIFLVEDDENE